jgi:5-oxoprolinase (ATP-hydrolysing)
VLLLVNQGFGDILRIGNQARPKLFDLNVRLPDLLHERVAEIGGRVAVDLLRLRGVPLEKGANICSALAMLTGTAVFIYGCAIVPAASRSLC